MLVSKKAKVPALPLLLTTRAELQTCPSNSVCRIDTQDHRHLHLPRETPQSRGWPGPGDGKRPKAPAQNWQTTLPCTTYGAVIS